MSETHGPGTGQEPEAHGDPAPEGTAPETPSGTTPTSLPSGAILQEDSATEGAGSEATSGSHVLTRRKVLTGAGVGLAVVAAGFAGWGLGRSGSGGASVAAQSGQSGSGTLTLPLVYGADVCEAPLFAAYENGFFEEQNLNVVLKKTGSGEDTHAAVGSGKYVGAPGIFFSWLKPIEQGQDVKLAIGLHQGCLRLVIKKGGDITELSQLKGKKIGVSGLQSSALNFFSLDLLDAGIAPNPEAGQVEWVVIDNDLLPEALKEGRVDAIAASDPIALLPTLESEGAWAEELTNNMQGHNAQQYCCATALNGALVRDHPDIAKKLVTAWADGSRWVGEHPEETAELEISKNYVAGTDVDTVASILTTYTFEPSASGLREALEPGIEKFAQTGFLDQATDPATLADKVFVDLGLDW